MRFTTAIVVTLVTLLAVVKAASTDLSKLTTATASDTVRLIDGNSDDVRIKRFLRVNEEDELTEERTISQSIADKAKTAAEKFKPTTEKFAGKLKPIAEKLKEILKPITNRIQAIPMVKRVKEKLNQVLADYRDRRAARMYKEWLQKGYTPERV